MRSPWLVLGLLVACGDDAGSMPDAAEVDAPAEPDAAPDAPPDADTRDIAVRLSELPGVVATEYSCIFAQNYRCFRITFEQPVDHNVVGGQTFLQHATLVHASQTRPFIAITSGYDDNYGDYRDEPTVLLNGNQLSLEHRYFNQSRPDPTDWTKLTVEQMAADQHHVAELLKPIYTGPWIATGASKGGMTASYYRRFYPEDTVAALPYVAPLSHGRNDPRYNVFMDSVGNAECRGKLKAIQVEMLAQARFDALVQRAVAEGADYTRVLVGPAVEAAITGLEFSFWQQKYETMCDQVPATTATDLALWQFLNSTNAPSNNSDPIVESLEAYFYQAEYELGYPDAIAPHLAGLTRYTRTDYAGIYPEGVTLPAFREATMTDVESWVASEGERLLFVYGETDPWTAGRYPLPATDSLSLTAPDSNHGSNLTTLAPADRDAALAKLEAWTGVTPNVRAVTDQPARPRPRLIPSAFLRAH